MHHKKFDNIGLEVIIIHKAHCLSNAVFVVHSYCRCSIIFSHSRQLISEEKALKCIDLLSTKDHTETFRDQLLKVVENLAAKDTRE